MSLSLVFGLGFALLFGGCVIGLLFKQLGKLLAGCRSCACRRHNVAKPQMVSSGAQFSGAQMVSSGGGR